MLLSENSGLHFPILFSIIYSAVFSICCSRPCVVERDSNKKHLQTQLLVHVQFHTNALPAFVLICLKKVIICL